MAEKRKQRLNTTKRPPIVVVMGHIDHGKTTLLDNIRKSNVASKEAGGITQHIGAYDIVVQSNNPEYNGRKITFIDTPGHEAFSAIRARGAQVGDIAILVIAGDEGVKPQTIEALTLIQQAKIPFIVALNKSDKPEFNSDKVKTQLTELRVLVEGWGGKVPVINISAKEGKNIQELLELILLMADIEDFKAEKNVPAKGVIIETKFDNKRGIIVTAIIKNGILRVGDLIYTESTIGKIRTMENCSGHQIKEADASSPVLLIGFKEMPQVGEELMVGIKTEEELKQIRQEKQKLIAKEAEVSNENVLNVIIKADVVGSLEAMKKVLENLNLPEGVSLKIINESIGDVFVSDVALAEAAPAIILGFRVKIPKDLQVVIQAKNIRVYIFDVIYEMEKFLNEEFEQILKPQEPSIKGRVEILACFSKKRSEQVIGGKVMEGRIVKGAQVKIQRGEEIVGRGKILNLQSNKLDVKEVLEGKECGILIDSDVEIVSGDQLIFQ